MMESLAHSKQRSPRSKSDHVNILQKPQERGRGDMFLRCGQPSRKTILQLDNSKIFGLIYTECDINVECSLNSPYSLTPSTDPISSNTTCATSAGRPNNYSYPHPILILGGYKDDLGSSVKTSDLYRIFHHIPICSSRYLRGQCELVVYYARGLIT